MREKSGLFYASVHRAGSQRDKSVLVTSRLFGPFPFRRNLFAEKGLASSFDRTILTKLGNPS